MVNLKPTYKRNLLLRKQKSADFMKIFGLLNSRIDKVGNYKTSDMGRSEH